MFRLDRHGEVARLTLDRPEARNAIPADGWASLAGRLEAAARSGARLLVVTGAGSAFCAGADLDDFGPMRHDAEAAARFRSAMRDAIDRLARLDMPVVAQIEGPCYGAGVALAIACDLRVAGRDARFAITPARIGLSYPLEDVHRLVSLIGTGQAARLLFSAASIDGAEAARIGLVELHDPEGGLDAIVSAIVGNSADSLAALKGAIRLAGDGRRSDADQDARFDALVAGDALAARLEDLRRK